LPQFLHFALDDQIDDADLAELAQLINRKARAGFIAKRPTKLVGKVACTHPPGSAIPWFVWGDA
jgi:hypothetical protein